MNKINSGDVNLGSREFSGTQEIAREGESKITSNAIRVRNGKYLVIAGFGIAIVGIVLYCVSSFSAGPGLGEPGFNNEGLGVIGVGVLLWLIGAVKYLNAAIDSDASDEYLF